MTAAMTSDEAIISLIRYSHWILAMVGEGHDELYIVPMFQIMEI